MFRVLYKYTNSSQKFSLNYRSCEHLLSDFNVSHKRQCCIQHCLLVVNFQARQLVRCMTKISERRENIKGNKN